MASNNGAMTDSDLIRELGGARAVAVLLGYPVQGGQQRVCNWLRRGQIPWQVKLEKAALFSMALDAATTRRARARKTQRGT